MKLSLKFSLSVILLIAAVLSLGCVLFLQQDFDENIRQAKTAAAQEHSRQAALIQMMLDEDSPDSQGAVSSSLFQYADSLKSYGAQSQLALYQGELMAFSSLDLSVNESIYMPLIRQCRENGADVQLLTQIGQEYWLLSCSAVPYRDYEVELVMARRVSDVFARRDRSAAWFMRIELLVVSLAAVAAVIVGSVLTRPLARLNRTARAIAGGELSARTNIHGSDEIAQLSHSFDHMADVVQSQIDQLSLSVTQRDDFIAAFTHEIKTPMTCIIGYADILREADSDAATLQSAADAIYHDARRLETLSQKLLLLYRLNREQTLPMLPVPLESIWREAAGALANPPRVKWADPMGGRVLGDEALLTNLMQNLVQNALRSLPAQGGWVAVTAEAEKNGVKITVTDNGCGMTPEQLHRVTEPFYMVDKSRARSMNGSGIGLALCARIAELHGSTLHFESEPGVGTRCSFCLPQPPNKEQ